MTDSVEAQPPLGGREPSGVVGGAIPDNVEGEPRSTFPWQSKRPWEAAGMSRSQWWRKGKPTEKPAPSTGETVIAKRLQEAAAKGRKPPRHTTPEAKGIRQLIVDLWNAKVAKGNNAGLKFGDILAAAQAKGIASKSRNNLYYHIDQTVKLGLVPPGAIDMQPRGTIDPMLLDHVIRLATPAGAGDTTSVPKITEALLSEGHLKGDSAHAQNEAVRRYVNKGLELGRIKKEWVHNGHRSEKRERMKDLTPQIIAQNAPINVRGVFYKLVAAKAADKADAVNELARVSSILVEQREAGIIDADDIVDIRGTVHHAQGFSDLVEGLDYFAKRWYRRDPWLRIEDRVIIGIEKAGLGDVIRPVCDKYQVPLIVAGGFGSYTLAKDTAQLIEAHDGSTYVYYFGDHDPSGLSIDESFERRLTQLAPNSSFQFQRVGLKPEHIERYGMETRPVNKNDRRAAEFVKRFGNAAADLDAVDPHTLRGWVEERIRLHISQDDLDNAARAEESDKERLRKLVQDERLRDLIETITQS